MSLQSDIPLDATHYFLWWDGLHIYKKDGKEWFWFINGKWRNVPKEKYMKISWFFGYHQIAFGYRHKLHKVTWIKP